MVYVNETFSSWTIFSFEIEIAYHAYVSPVFDAFPPRFRVSLVYVNRDKLLSPFKNCFPFRKLFR